MSVARENFLEKLKREREEASKHQSKKAANSLNDSSTKDVRAELPSFSAKIPSDDESSSESSSSEEEEEEPVKHVKSTPAKNNSRHFGSEDEEEEVDSTFLKKKSKRFLENGKVCEDTSFSWKIFKTRLFASQFTIYFIDFPDKN